jgi:hypothetical protein
VIDAAYESASIGAEVRLDPPTAGTISAPAPTTASLPTTAFLPNTTDEGA